MKFSKIINDHIEAILRPSTTICVDESVSRFYDIGGEWTNDGFPIYVAIDYKPENGCKIQDSANGN